MYQYSKAFCGYQQMDARSSQEVLECVDQDNVSHGDKETLSQMDVSVEPVLAARIDKVSAKCFNGKRIFVVRHSFDMLKFLKYFCEECDYIMCLCVIRNQKRSTNEGVVHPREKG